MFRAILIGVSILAASPVLAQNSTSADPTVPVPPAETASPPAEKIAPPSGTMSSQLSQHNGTVSPPNVDPGMTITPPKTGSATTPVIPPPGNGSVVPK